MDRQTFFRTSMIGLGVAVSGLTVGKQIGLNSEYSIGNWEFIAKEQRGGQNMEDYLRGNIRSKGSLT